MYMRHSVGRNRTDSIICKHHHVYLVAPALHLSGIVRQKAYMMSLYQHFGVIPDRGDPLLS